MMIKTLEDMLPTMSCLPINLAFVRVSFAVLGTLEAERLPSIIICDSRSPSRPIS
jgi:hypothetical protein